MLSGAFSWRWSVVSGIVYAHTRSSEYFWVELNQIFHLSRRCADSSDAPAWYCAIDMDRSNTRGWRWRHLGFRYTKQRRQLTTRQNLKIIESKSAVLRLDVLLLEIISSKMCYNQKNELLLEYSCGWWNFSCLLTYDFIRRYFDINEQKYITYHIFFLKDSGDASCSELY